MKSIVLITPLLALLLSSQAQQNDFNFVNLSSKEGLSSNNVNVIHKDRYGYMWFGTGDGLNKFDGVNCTVYRNKTNDSTSIGSNIILAMCEDQSGNLWIGTNHTLSLYNRKKDAFINYTVSYKYPVRALGIDHLGNVWTGGYGGLTMFDPRTGKTNYYRTEPGKANQLASNTVFAIFEDSRRRLWVGTKRGVHLYNRARDNFHLFEHNEADPSSISDNEIRAITEDAQGNLWFASTNGGLNKLNADERTFTHYRHNQNDVNTLSSDRVYAIAADNNGKLWTGTEEGLGIFDLSTSKVRRVLTDQRNTYGLRGKSVRSIFIDKNGIYWVGTDKGGVYKYDKNLTFFNLRQSNPLDPSGLSSSFVTSFAEGPGGDIYVGTDAGGLNLYHRKTGLFEHPALTTGNNNKALSILAMERAGNELWIGTFQQGLYVLNMLSGAVKHYTKGEGPNNLLGNDIFCIKKDSKGNIWIGTNGDGVNVYDPTSGTFHRFNKEKIFANGARLIINGYIRAIEEDQSGNIWIGTNGSGIAVIDPSWKNYRLLSHDNSRLSSNQVLSMHAGRNGDMWVGTNSGLSCYKKNTNHFISWSEPDGLSNSVIFKILEDESGKLWISTNKGISSFNPQSRRFKNYSHYNGLQRSPFVLGSGLITSTGDIFFGGLDGFNFFNPKTLHCNKNVPTLHFTALKISNQLVVPGENAAIKEHVSIASEIRLDYKQNFSLDFAAMNYTDPQEGRYSYKLDGFDKEWNDVGTAHTAVYTNLDPGEYTFRVKAASDDSLWATPERTIKIYVKPPFWRNIYAYIFYMVAGAMLIVLFRYRAIRRLKNKFALEQERLQVKQMIEQERMEAERQHEFDQLRIRFLTNLSHEFRTPISLIAGPVDKLFQEEERKEKQEQLAMVKRNAGRLLNLVNQLLDFKKLEENELKLNLAEGDMVSFARDMTDTFKDIATSKQIRLIFSCTLKQYHTLFDKDKIERILLNLLSNAFKFTGKGGEIRVTLQQVDGNLAIVVADTGIGMTPEVQARIFDRFYQADTNSQLLYEGSGIGLSIAKEFVKLHEGNIQVESTPGKGTIFTVLLPCRPIGDPVETTEQPAVLSSDNLLPAQPTPGNGLPDHEKLTVLLIEDNDDFRNYLRNNLKPFYKIVEASDGKEGWQKTLSAHPQVIVSDINMPGMDGITLSRKIKLDKRTSHIPIILLTAMTGDAYHLKGLETGASDYLSKPFNFDILNIRIKNLVALNQRLKNTYSRQLKIDTPEVTVESDDEKLLLNITQYIESNIDSPHLSVEDLSKHVFMSRGSLYNKLVSLTGETPVEYIRSIRLNKAAAMLEKNSDLKIAEIAYAVGFATPNYFAKAFKLKFSISPSEYANLKKAAGDPGGQSFPGFA